MHLHSLNIKFDIRTLIGHGLHIYSWCGGIGGATWKERGGDKWLA